MLCYLDTETFSLAGPPVTVQYAFDDGPIEIWNFWTNPIRDSLELIESFAETNIVGFNLAFDSFQINKIYNLLLSFPDQGAYPEDHIDDLGMLEDRARDGLCVKPKACCDILLVARRTKYQKTMERKPIRIKKVPTPIAWQLAEILEKKVIMEDILFHRRKDKFAPKWRVEDIKMADGKINPNFKNVTLKFKASTALKALAADALGEEVLLYKDIEAGIYAEDNRFAPFATSVGTKGDWKGAWPDIAKIHINHWEHNPLARKYAAADIDYTRKLYKHFDSPTPGDDDSELAWMVGAVRLKGYRIDIDAIKKLRQEAVEKKKKYPTAPRQVKHYINELMAPEEKLVLTTKKIVLEEISTWKKKKCPFCTVVDPDCTVCNGTGHYTHPAAERAINCLDARKSTKKIELLDKLLLAGRLHASVNVIGTLSGRMSGGDKLNVHGIDKTKETRQCFSLAWPGYNLDGGDFDSFEVTLADAVFDDPDLRRQLQEMRPCVECKQKGKVFSKKKNIEITCPDCNGTLLASTKIHALFGMEVYPGMSYEDILATKGTSDDKYTRSKSAVFAMIYGGEDYTLMTRLGVDIDTARAAFISFGKRYPGVAKARAIIGEMFKSMQQPGGLGTRVEWHEPADYVESPVGFRRYFTLENKICRALFDLAQNPPQSLKNCKIKVVRHDREQTASGALQSALYGAAFAIQGSNTRAATNHVIQSYGSTITKAVQRQIWEIQPPGVHKFYVMPLSIHDEIMCPNLPEVREKVKEAVENTVEKYRTKVPLIKLDWGLGLNSWADK